ncbi:MAG: hypothetical protein VB858_20270, partial [Planctomycetaceae bacterium]
MKCRIRRSMCHGVTREIRLTGPSAGKSSLSPHPVVPGCLADLCFSGDFVIEDYAVNSSGTTTHIEDRQVPDVEPVTVRELNPLELEGEFLTQWRQLE